MSTIINSGERYRRAVQWISEQVKATNKSPQSFVEEALVKFDLTPLQCDTLTRTFFDIDGKDSE